MTVSSSSNRFMERHQQHSYKTYTNNPIVLLIYLFRQKFGMREDEDKALPYIYEIRF